MDSKVLIEKRPEEAFEPRPDVALRLLMWVGAALALVGWLDVLLLWFPAKFGTPEWEFGTVSATFDALPLGTIGVVMLLAAAAAHGWRRVMLGGAVASVVMAVLLSAALILFALDVPLAWQGVTEAYLPALQKAMFKTVILGVVYVTLYAVTGVATLRLVRRNPWGST